MQISNAVGKAGDLADSEVLLADHCKPHSFDINQQGGAILKSGTMVKRGGPLRVWKSRWFELYPGKLAYSYQNYVSFESRSIIVRFPYVWTRSLGCSTYQSGVIVFVCCLPN